MTTAPCPACKATDDLRVVVAGLSVCKTCADEFGRPEGYVSPLRQQAHAAEGE